MYKEDSVQCVQKKTPIFIFMITLGKVDQLSYFSLLYSERICRRSWN